MVRRPSWGAWDLSHSQQFSRKQKQTQQVQMDEQGGEGEGEGCFQDWQETGQEGQQGTHCRGCQVRLGPQHPSRGLWPSQATTEDAWT